MPKVAELRVVLRDGEQAAMLLGATLLDSNDLYCSSPMRGGGQLFKASIHNDGKTHIYLADTTRLIGAPVTPLGQSNERHRVASWSGEFWPFSWRYKPKRSSGIRANLIHSVDEMAGIPAWAIDLWVLGMSDEVAVETMLEEEYCNLIILGHVSTDSQPNLFAITWTFPQDAWHELEQLESVISINSISMLPGGQFIAVYKGEPDLVAGTEYDRIDCAIRIDKRWSSSISIDRGATENATDAVTFLDKEGRIHVFYRDAPIMGDALFATFPAEGPKSFGSFPIADPPSDD